MQLESVCSIPVHEFLVAGRAVRTFPFDAFVRSIAFSPARVFDLSAAALHWPTRRLAALGAGRCDILLVHD